MSAIISFDQVAKTYGEITALSKVSFEIKKGEFVFISGPSGSGKTTILRLLLRDIEPSSGVVMFDGKDISGISKKELPFYRRNIGVVFQDFRLLPERTVKENLETALAVAEIEKEKWGERISQILSLVGLSDRGEVFPSQLSGGELQRISLARALVPNPEVVFADEPTGNLDMDNASSIMDLLLKINKEGKTVIVASHHQALIDKLKKRTIELKKGSQEKAKKEEVPETKEEEKEKPENTKEKKEEKKEEEK